AGQQDSEELCHRQRGSVDDRRDALILDGDVRHDTSAGVVNGAEQGIGGRRGRGGQPAARAGLSAAGRGAGGGGGGWRVGGGGGDGGGFGEVGGGGGGGGGGDGLAGVVALAQCASDEFVEGELLGPGDLDDPVHRRADGDVRQRAGHVLGGHGLDEHVCQAHRVAAGGLVGDAADELEELGRVDDRVGDRGVLDQLLLGNLRPHVTTVGQAVGPHDRQRHVMPNASG